MSSTGCDAGVVDEDPSRSLYIEPLNPTAGSKRR
jgi:hypothetical protein